MAAKAITNLALFVGGNASQPVPSKAMMTYKVTEGEKSANGVYNFPDIDSGKSANEIWAEGVSAIKAKEGMGE